MWGEVKGTHATEGPQPGMQTSGLMLLWHVHESPHYNCTPYLEIREKLNIVKLLPKTVHSRC